MFSFCLSDVTNCVSPLVKSQTVFSSRQYYSSRSMFGGR